MSDPVHHPRPLSKGKRGLPAWAFGLLIGVLGLGLISVIFFLPGLIAPSSEAVTIVANRPEIIEAEPEPEPIVVRSVAEVDVIEPEIEEPQPDAVVEDPAPHPVEHPIAPQPKPEPISPFDAAIARASEALAAENFTAAKSAFKLAQTMNAKHPAVIDGLAQAELGLRVERIGNYRAQALIAEAKEDWQQALDAYKSVLALDENVSFAREGLQRAAQRKALYEALDRHLHKPERLSDKQVAREAEELLVRTEQLSDPPKGLVTRINQLRAFVEQYEEPRVVHLISDNQTEVTVYKVGRLGKFTNKQLDLRPGTYIVTGSRDGYQDVRVSLELAAGSSEPHSLEIRCKEKI